MEVTATRAPRVKKFQNLELLVEKALDRS